MTRDANRVYAGGSFRTPNASERFGQRNIENKHPAVFPLKLAQDNILSWTNPNGIVLDSFMGSGTSALAAPQTGRKFIAVELSSEYKASAEGRIKTASRVAPENEVTLCA